MTYIDRMPGVRSAGQKVEKQRPTPDQPDVPYPKVFHVSDSMAERVGFEPTIPFSQDTAFRERSLQPLGHLSGFAVQRTIHTLFGHLCQQEHVGNVLNWAPLFST